jgi:UDP-glucose 4-epimerase
MKRVWVFGAGGMLGAAITRELHRQGVIVYRYAESFDWRDLDRLRLQFGQAVKEFLAGLSGDDDWDIYWAAGVGSMGSTRTDLEGETAALEILLALLREQLSGRGTLGSIGFASSAGALYAGCADFEITEASPVTAVSDYARTKLLQEQMLEEFVSGVEGVKLLVARFSTLFGPGQSFGKRQGLLSHIARCALRHQPVEIFVPLDTSRDYLFADDAACDFIESSRALRDHDGRSLVKIIAAERSVTISEIVSTFNRLIKKRLRLVCNRNSISNLYAPRVAYRSMSPLANRSGFQRHTLLEGAAVLLRAERMAYIGGTYKG